MSLLTALYSGVSGLSANGMAIAVIGDNIANVNTVGFKGSRMLFQDMLSQSVLGGQLGRGTSPQSIDKQMTQGNLSPTGNVTDLALSGDGFFVLRSPSGGQSFTRAGQFRLDSQGSLVNPNGQIVQGYPFSDTGAATGLADLSFPQTQSLPKVSATVKIAANLDSREGTPPTGGSNYTSSISVYDSLGVKHDLTVTYTKTGPNAWSWEAAPPPGDLTTGATHTKASGTLAFDTDGKLLTSTAGPNTFDFNGAAQGQAITFDFGTGISGTTQFGAKTTVNSQSQDGYGAGVLQGITIDKDGLASGQFSNGTTRALAYVAVANFQSNGGLEKGGGSTYRETVASGQALIGRANQGPRGQVNSSSLELSNVDLANEFVNMITIQRAYQANSKTITTADSLLGEVINLKRG